MKSKLGSAFSFSLLLLFLFATVGLSAERVLTPEQSTRLELFKKAFFKKLKTDLDLKAHRAAVNELKFVDHPKSVDYLLKHVFKDKDWKTRYEGVKAMSTFEFADTLEQIRSKGLSSGNIQVKVGCVEAMTIGDRREMIKDILALSTDRNPQVRNKVSQAIDRLKPNGAVKHLVTMLEAESVDSVRVGLLHALQHFADPSSAAAVATCLTADPWQVKSAAIGTLKAIRTKNCIGPLVEAYQTAIKGRITHELLDALEICTGKYYGEHPEAWAGWWKMAKKNFTVPPMSEIIGGGSAIKPKDTWFGIPFVSHESNIIFVIDLSNSMNELIKYSGPPGKDGPNGVGSNNNKPDGVGSGDGEIENDNDPNNDARKGRVYNGTTKLAIVKEELAYAIQDFDDTTNFNIIMFNTEEDMVMLHKWKKELTKASERNKKNALDWILNREAEGRTPIYDAVIEAIREGQERPVEKGYATTGADTIFVLSDGQPSDGEETDRDIVVELVTRANALKKIQIHCIAAGHYQNEVLSNIARQNWGKFVVIGETQ